MHVTGHRTTSDALIVETATGRLLLQELAPGAIRVAFTARDEFSTAPSMALLGDLVRSAPDVVETEEALVASTPLLSARLDRATGALTWRDAQGERLFREPHDGHPTRVLRECDVLRPVFGDDARIATTTGADGAKATVTDFERVVDRQAYSTKLRLELAEGEAIYGLGQHEEGILDYRGHHQDLYQQNMKVAVPVIVSSRGYGICWDSQSLASFHDDQHGTYFWTDVDDEMDFVVVAGPELDDVVGRIRTITGQSPMLPRWAMGYIQSKDRYVDAEELVDVVGEFRRRHIPIDCIVQDWQHWPDGQWGQKSFDPQRYPDPRSLIDTLHALDVRLMVSIWPNMQGDGPNQRQMRERGHLLGNDSTYDAFDADARNLYWEQTREGYWRHGVDGFWADCTEPFEGDWKGAVEPEPWQRLIINTDELKTYLDPEHINGYSLQHSGGLYQGQRATDESKRSLLLTRSGSLGQQRYGSVVWSGDHSATWESLRRQVPEALNFCVTGNPFWTSDIGAYFVTPGDMWFWRGDFPDGVSDSGYRELYVRWLQLGAFTPVFRSHGRCTPREPWRFGDDGDLEYDTILKFIRLRYRLLPYLYSLMGWTTHRAYTPMRSLAFDFRHDPEALRVTDQFMLGPALLVCPVTEPMEFGPGSTPLENVPRSRSVYLPAGTDWYDFWTGRRHRGGQRIAADAPLEIVPLFVRAGSILPMDPVVEHTGADAGSPLEVRVYPGADGSFDLYEDGGDGYGYERGEFATTLLTWDDTAGVLDVGPTVGTYPGRLQRDVVTIVVTERAGLGEMPFLTAGDVDRLPE